MFVAIIFINIEDIFMHILAEICTRGRYDSTLPSALISLAQQTRKVDGFVLLDDNPESERWDLRNVEIYQYIFKLFDSKGIPWKVVFGGGRGIAVGHQKCQDMAKTLVFRFDDDVILEPNALEVLESNMTEGVGAVAGLVLWPNGAVKKDCGPNLISHFKTGGNQTQWFLWDGVKTDNEHLYSCFLYRKGINTYDTELTPAVCDKEDTLFSYGIFKKGYKLVIDSQARMWHFRCSTGGIRSGKKEDFQRDTARFYEILREYNNEFFALLNVGKGDHLVFKSILPKIKERYKKVTLAVCYPEIFPEEETISVAEGQKLCHPEKHDIYTWCARNNWTESLALAYAKMYGITP
jgi:hypothetical protein